MRRILLSKTDHLMCMAGFLILRTGSEERLPEAVRMQNGRNPPGEQQ
jgi:hypothetical protein